MPYIPASNYLFLFNCQTPPPPPPHSTGSPNQQPIYTYCADLLALDSYYNPSPPILPDYLRNITTPLDADVWAEQLKAHPDPAFTQYIVEGIRHGFRIGFSHTCLCSPAPSNHPSASEHPEVISERLTAETSKGRLIGPLDPTQFPFVQISSLGAVPKKHSENKWRLILDLSHPKASSVNDGISRDLCSLTYMRVDDVVHKVLSMGRGALLAKIDIENAFRNVPVHPHDRYLLGMKWNDQLFIDTVLPFGLRSAPKIFNALADALQWIARNLGVSYLEHFLDDYITGGAPGTEECNNNLLLLVAICAMLNIPLAVTKREGPSTCLTFLGIIIDTVNLELRLPTEKLHRLQALLEKWIRYKCCKKKDLESLVGYLQDASRVVHSGRTFTRRLIDLLKSARHRTANSFSRLNAEARSDIFWWHSFIQHWNGISMMVASRKCNPDVILTSDASGSWGCGAFYAGDWFQHQWSPHTINYTITAKELLPIVMAAAIWGPHWANKSVLCRCDNEAVVCILNTGTSRDPTVMGLMRCLHFIAAKFNMLISAVHLAGTRNTLADALSRNNLPLFFKHYPQANHKPSTIPYNLLDLLVLSKPDWTSPLWNRTFSSIFSQHSPAAPCAHTPPATAATWSSAPTTTSSPIPLMRIPSVNLWPTLGSNTSSTKQLNAISLASDSFTLFKPTPILSSRTCPGSTMSYEESKPKRQKLISHHANAYQSPQRFY